MSAEDDEVIFVKEVPAPEGIGCVAALKSLLKRTTASMRLKRSADASSGNGPPSAEAPSPGDPK